MSLFLRNFLTNEERQHLNFHYSNTWGSAILSLEYGNKIISTMDIKELINKAFNKDLPIGGGMGNSIEEAVILKSAGPINDYVYMEY